MGKLSLLTKLIIVVAVITAIDVFLFLSIIQPKKPISFNEEENTNLVNINQIKQKQINTKSILNNLNNTNSINELPISVQMTAIADKSTYSSYETIFLNIKITSNQDLSNVNIAAKGITDRLNRNYFNQNQIVPLSKNIVKEVNLSQTLPSCNSCSGLTPGNYSIEVAVDYQGKTLVSKSINLTIKQ